MLTHGIVNSHPGAAGRLACFIGGAVLLAATVSLAGFTEDAAPAAQKPGPLFAERKRTDVLPHSQGAIVAGRNYVYCGTFQLA